MSILYVMLLIVVLLTIIGPIWAAYALYRAVPRWIGAWRRKQAVQDAILREMARIEEDTRSRAGPDLYESPATSDIIALNRETRQMIVGTFANPSYVPFEKIVHAEIITGGATITQTDRSQSGTWLLGGSEIGQTWALRSAITADRLSRDLVVDLSIKVTVDDWNDPVHMVCFLAVDQGGVDPRSALGAAAIQMVDDVYAKLNLIIRHNASSPAKPDGDRLTA